EVHRDDGAERSVDEEIEQHEERVLQDRQDERGDGHAIRNSIVVRPIVMRSPPSRSCSRTLRLFTIVPLVEPRPTSAYPPSVARTSAWLRDAPGSAIVMSEVGSRPIVTGSSSSGNSLRP